MYIVYMYIYIYIYAAYILLLVAVTVKRTAFETEANKMFLHLY